MTKADGPLTIGIDAGYDPGWTAGLLYIRNLVYSLASLPPSDAPLVRLLPVTPETVSRVHDLASLPFVEIAAGEGNDRRLSRQLFMRRIKRRWLQPLVRIPLDSAFSGLDATFPGFGKPVPGVTQVHWVPDLQHVHLPHLFSKKERSTRDERIQGFMQRTGTVVVSSQAARDDLLRFAPRARATVRVWRFCTGLTEAELEGREPRSTYSLPDFYLYVANQFWAHKEHLTMFKALRLLKDRGLSPTLVCTGALRDDRDPTYADRLLAYVDNAGLREQIKLLGLIDRADQIQVMRCAAAVIQPSRFEGWSTVVEDAKALGVPLLLSNIDVHLEQVPTGRFFEVGSESSLASALENLLADLVPGPRPEHEALAADATFRRRQEAARLFLSIVCEAVERDRQN